MAEEVKKISFGFSKLAKKTSIVSTKVPKKEDSKVEFIDCLEGKSIKLKDPVKYDDKPLVIPLKRESKIVGYTSTDAVNSGPDIEALDDLSKSKPVGPVCESINKNNESISNGSPPMIKETLDEKATREILEDLNKKNNEEETRVFSVPLPSSATVGEKESSLDDYENIPINQFGEAMLRGMGWAPGKGIGKKERLAVASMPTLRPKGMGLGADKVIKTTIESKKTDGEELKMEIGSFIRIIAGSNKDCYGQIEGFDEESGRMIVKLPLKNVSVSVNEFMAQLVDKTEYLKNSKVINVGKYEKYKHSEDKHKLSDYSSQGDTKPVTRPTLTEEMKNCESQSSNTTEKNKIHQSRSTSRSTTPEDGKGRKNSFRTTSRHHDNSIHEVSSYKMSSHKTRLRQSRSNSSEQSNSSSEYLDKRKYRTKKKKPTSHRYRSRTRSRSPRTHKSHRHKNQKKRK